jgi:GNAT superfamily N-acetyltransferase
MINRGKEMQNDPIIRAVRPDEIPEVKRLIYSIAHPLMEPQIPLEEMINLWEGWGVFNDLQDVQKNYFENRGVFLVVEINGCIVGTGALNRFTEFDVFSENGRLRTNDWQLHSGDRVCALHRITLLPTHQGKKLGYLAYALLLDLIQRASELGYNRMILWTDPIKLHRAVRFYRLLGFTDLPIEGTDPDELWLGIGI